MPAQVVVVAKHSYTKPGDNILNFSRGDLLEVLEETNAKWWAARLVKDEESAGYIPASYVEVAHPDLLADSSAVKPATTRNSSGSFRQRLKLFETESVPSYSPQPPRNDWSRSTLPAKSGFGQNSSPLSSATSSPVKSATLARDVPEITVIMESSEERNGVKLRNASSAQLINPQGALAKELKFEQKRGVTLGRSELQKVFDGGVSSSGHVSPKPQRSKSGSCQTMDSTSELGKMLLKQTNKIAEHERMEEEEESKPEFMRLQLKKSSDKV